MFKRYRGLAIGCEISSAAIRLAQIQQRQQRWELVLDRRPIPHDLIPERVEYAETLSDLLGEMLQSGRFIGSDVVSCLPAHRLMYRMMRLASMPPDELARAAHWKAAAELGLKADSFKSAALILEQSQSRTANQKTVPLEIAVVGAENALLQQHVSIMTRAGLRPVAIDSSTCAAVRCLSALPGGAEAMVVEMTPSTVIAAVAEAGQPVFIRSAGEGLNRICQLLSDMLGVTQDEAAEMVRTARGDETPADEQQTPDLQQSLLIAGKSIADAQCMYARDLARELLLSMHYLSQTLGRPVPASATVIAQQPLHPEALQALADGTGIVFAPAAGISQRWPEAAAQLPPREDIAQWVAAIGLSMYERPLAIREAA